MFFDVTEYKMRESKSQRGECKMEKRKKNAKTFVRSLTRNMVRAYI